MTVASGVAAAASAAKATSAPVLTSALAASQPIYVQMVGGASGWRELIPFGTALVGAAAVLVANWINNLHSRDLAKMNLQAGATQKGAELRLERLEELYALFDRWQQHVQVLYLWHLNCYAGKLEYKVVMEEVRKQKLPDGDLQRLNALAAMYVPGLKDSYQAVLAARKANAPFLGDPKGTNLTKAAFIEAQNEFGRAANQFLEDVASEARKYVEALKA